MLKVEPLYDLGKWGEGKGHLRMFMARLSTWMNGLSTAKAET